MINTLSIQDGLKRTCEAGLWATGPHLQYMNHVVFFVHVCVYVCPTLWSVPIKRGFALSVTLGDTDVISHHLVNSKVSTDGKQEVDGVGFVVQQQYSDTEHE